jgi:hypothetical protein
VAFRAVGGKVGLMSDRLAQQHCSVKLGIRRHIIGECENTVDRAIGAEGRPIHKIGR